jgi:tryptophanyl-tRNA synthetase
MNTQPNRRRVFSGVQPTGVLHIGNYFGALRRWLAEQATKECYYCIVDMHAITIPQDPEILRQATLSVTALYLAVGLDPEQSIIYVQSHVRAHAELCWILNCITPVGWLERMTQYKSKAAELESVNTGLLDYPVLQAADILLYDAHEVPVGEDQKQHVELARDIAQRFNFLYGETFVIPEVVLPATGARIRALNDPTRKMSKSEAHIRGHAIRLVDEPDEIRDAIQHAVTDSGREILFSDAPEKAGVNNLLEIYALCTGMDHREIEVHFTGHGYRTFKQEVAEAIIETLRPIRERYRRLIADPGEIERLLAIGACKARLVAKPKVESVKSKVGFIPRRRGEG